MKSSGTGYTLKYLPLLLGTLLLAACAGQKETKVPPPEPEPDTTAVIEEPTVRVQVTMENLRATPNGDKVGETSGGTEFVLEERRGNWAQVRHPELGGVWIWAPSVGFAKTDPLSVPLWLGGRNPQIVDSLTAVVGQPLDVEALGGNVFLYNYPNVREGGGTVFGTWSFHEATAWIDGKSREVLRVEFDLPPFEGSAKELLTAVKLPTVRSTKTDFERALYTDKFAGITQLEMLFAKGDFHQIEFLGAERYPKDAFDGALTDGEKKIVHEGDQLILSMEVRNNSGEYAFAAPAVKVALHQGGLMIGEWTLGPVDVRIEPGATELLYEPLPLDDTEVDINQVAASAEIISAFTVPAGVVSQP